MTTTKLRVDFLSDPGHGWAQVPMEVLQQLGIEDRISDCSYLRDGYAYLEEDLDWSTFVEAAAAAGMVVTVREHHTDRLSRVRNYAHYTSPNGVCDCRACVQSGLPDPPARCEMVWDRAGSRGWCSKFERDPSLIQLQK